MPSYMMWMAPQSLGSPIQMGDLPTDHLNTLGVRIRMRCRILQCFDNIITYVTDETCDGVLQCVAVCCSVMCLYAWVVVYYSVSTTSSPLWQMSYLTVCCSVLQCVAVCCSVLQCDMRISSVVVHNSASAIDWFWLSIFRANLARGLSNKAMKFQNKGAVPVQIDPLWISQPRNRNQSVSSHMWWMSHMTSHVLQCDAVCCSVVCAYAWVSAHYSASTISSHMWQTSHMRSHVSVCCSMLQRVWFSVAVCCGALQCVAVCCGMLQCVAVYWSASHVTSRMTWMPYTNVYFAPQITWIL